MVKNLKIKQKFIIIPVISYSLTKMTIAKRKLYSIIVSQKLDALLNTFFEQDANHDQKQLLNYYVSNY